MSAAVFYAELMDELATQSMARLGHNIFGKDTNAAMLASAVLTTSMQKTAKQWQNNPNGFGQMFETLEVGKENIKNAYNKTGVKTYTTDELDEIRRTKSEKGFKFSDTIRANYSEQEIERICNNKNLDDFAKTNHELVDTVSVDANGKVIKTAQLKAVNDNILSKSYDKYFEAGVDVLVDSDTYDRASAEIEKIKDNLRKAPAEKKAQIKKQLEAKEEKFKKLKRGSDKREAGYTEDAKENGGHTDVNEALKNTYKTQALESAKHIAQTGASDAVAVALSTLGASVVSEMEDEFLKNHHENFLTRLERIICKVLDAAKGAFARGASFGVLDTLLTIVSQVFKQIGGQIKYIWSNLRNGAKAIWNAVCDYISGKINTFADFLKITLKAILSMMLALFALKLEEQISSFLKPFLGKFAEVISAALTIFICAFAVVISMRGVELAIGGFFAICAKAEMAKQRREKIEAVYEKIMPQMLENKANLSKYLDGFVSELSSRSNMGFKQLQAALNSSNYAAANDKICQLAKLYGVDNLFKSSNEFKAFLASDEPWC